MSLARLWASFQPLPPLPTSKLGPSGADSWMGGFMYILGPVDLSNKLSCEAGSFSCHCKPHRFSQSEALRLYFPTAEPWVAWSVLLPSCSSQFIHMQMWDHQLLPRPPSLPAAALSCVLSTLPTCLNECFFFNSLVVRLP